MDVNCKVYRRRWTMLLIFCSASALNATHWLQYAIITNVVMRYYGVSAMFVNWSAMIYSAVYIPLVFPATWLIERRGLRISMILGLLMMVGGSWLKLLSLDQNMFVVAFICQSIIGCSQIFILSVPARLAGLWFPSNQVSTVCALGVLGNQLGSAVSFCMPPMVVKNCETIPEIRTNLMRLHIGIALITTFLLLAALCFFEDEPPLPPNWAQHSARERNLGLTYKTSLKTLFSNKDYILLLFTYGLNVGVFYAYSTLLNQMFLIHYPKGETDAGRIGMSLIFGGMGGTVLLGVFLDKTHYFKGTTLASYLMAITGIMGFSLALYKEYLVLIYVTSTFLGVFMTGYLAVAYEFAAELTYPLPESTSSGVLNSFGEAIGLILVSVAGTVVNRYGDMPTNVLLLSTLCFGFLVTLFMSGNNLRRLTASKQTSAMLT